MLHKPHRRKFLVPTLAGLAIVSLWCTSPSSAQDLRVTVENLSPTGGLFLTPVWLGIHDGTFDTYDLGASAAGFGGLEEIAEDGVTGPLSGRFATEQGGTGGVDDTLIGPAGPPPIDPGESASLLFSVADPTVNRYFSYASMVIPSNDAFIANGSPLAHPVFDAAGNFIGADFMVFGSEVLDAGTEQNTETSVAFLALPNGQTGPNQGADQNGVVALHAGFNGSAANPGGTPVNILGGMTVSGATIDATLGDFTNGTVPLLRITVTQIPEPGTLALTLFGALAVSCSARRNRRC